LNVRMFAQKTMTLLATNADGTALLDNTGTQVAWQLDYQPGESVTFHDRTAGVEWFTSEFAIRRIQETDMAGLPTTGTPGDGLGVHEATVEIGYKVGAIKVGTQQGVT